MKKLIFVLMGVFGLLFTTNVYASDPTNFRISRSQLLSNNVYGDHVYTDNFYLSYNSNTWFEGRPFWELGNELNTGLRFVDFATYNFSSNMSTDNNGNITYNVYQKFFTGITITLPHDEFCPIDKDCRIDTILRFYSECNVSSSVASCQALNSAQISDVRANWQPAPTNNHCSYKSGYNGKFSDIGLSCYSPKGEKLIIIDLHVLDKYYLPISSPSSIDIYPVDFYLMYPIVVQGDTLNSLNTGGFDIFNDDYTLTIEGQYGRVFNGIHSNGTITNLLTLPVTFVQRLVNSFNSSCSPVTIGNLWGTDFKLKCVNLTSFSSIFNIVDIFVSGFLAYAFGCKMVKLFHKFTSLKEGGLEEAYE